MIDRASIKDFDPVIIDFIFKSKYDNTRETFGKLNLNTKTIIAIERDFQSRSYDCTLLDWLRLSDKDLKYIDGLGWKQRKMYRRSINNYLIENNIDPKQFHHYINTFQLIQFCLNYNIDLISYSTAYKVLHDYMYNGAIIDQDMDDQLRRLIYNILGRYYTDTIYTGNSPTSFPGTNFNFLTGHTFNEFVQDCFSE